MTEEKILKDNKKRFKAIVLVDVPYIKLKMTLQ